MVRIAGGSRSTARLRRRVRGGVGLLAVGVLLGACNSEPKPPRSDLPTVRQLLADADGDPAKRDALIQSGAAVFDQMSCGVCHALDGTPMTGPRLDGLYDRPLKLTDGMTKPRDRAYLWRSIALPQDEFVHGYSGASRMTNFGRVLDNDDIAALIAYLESHSEKAANATAQSEE